MLFVGALFSSTSHSIKENFVLKIDSKDSKYENERNGR